MKLDWQFSKDGRRAAAVYPLMVSGNRAGTRAEIRLRADDTGRWEIDVVSEFGHCVKRGTSEKGNLKCAVLMAEDAWANALFGRDTPQCTRDGANRFAAELAEEEMRWEDE